MAFILSYLAYHLHCMTSPQSFFNIAEESTICLFNVAPDATKAKKVIFDKVAAIINRTGIFERRAWKPNPKVKSELKFEGKRVSIFPGNSSKSFPLGYDTYAGVIDEAAFWSTATEDPCEEIYHAMEDRRESRFHEHGMVSLITSPTYDTVFVEQLASQSVEDPTIFFRRRERYKCNPSYFHMPTFEYEFKKEHADGSVAVEILNIPEVFRKPLEVNPSQILRDVCARTTPAMSAYFQEWDRISPRVAGRPDIAPEPTPPDPAHRSPATPDDVWRRLPEDFRGNPAFAYGAHGDLATGGRAGKGECAGFAIVHGEKDEQGIIRFKLDLAVRFVASPSQEVQLAEVREKFIMRLQRERGFNYAKLTFDQKFSKESIQILQSQGVPAETKSVGWSEFEAYKEHLYSGKIDIYDCRPLLWEMRNLEDKGGKVEHRYGATDDLAYAVAGALSNAIECLIDAQKEADKPKRAARGVVVNKAAGHMGRSGGFTGVPQRAPVRRQPGSKWRNI